MVVNRQAVTIELAPKIQVPKSSGRILRRQRLIDLLHANLESGVQTVSAPAGYGKTTLLTDFCSDLDIPVCWYSMDSSDVDVEWFVKGIVASVKLQFREFGKATLSRLAVAEKGAIASTRLADALAMDFHHDISDYFLMVLDDYHAVEGSEVDGVMDRLLGQMPANCHVIISSRSAIDIPIIHNRIVHGQAFALSGGDLAFTVGEVKDLLAHQKGPAIPDAEVERLTSENQGWIVGLLLGFQSERSEGDLGVGNSLSRDNVFSYLASEVYERLPAETKDFLIRSSVLGQVDPEFCDRLLGISRSEWILRDIQKRNLFLSRIDPQSGAYRYHALFRDFLREKLADSDPDEFQRLHAKAGMMFEEEHRWEEAIDHFMKAGRYSQACDVLKAKGEELLDAGKWKAVARWTDALPARYRLNDEELRLLKAECDIQSGRIDEGAQALTQVISRATASDQWEQRARALSWRSAASRLSGNLDTALADIKMSISILEKNSGPSDNLGDAYRRLGTIQLDRGNLTAAVRHLTKALKYYSATFATAHTASIHNSLGVAYRQLGDLAKSSVHLDLARQCWKRLGNGGALASVLNNLGLVYQCQGDYDRALKTFRDGLQTARECGYRRIEACIIISIADLLRDVRMFDEALALYDEGLKAAEEVMEIYYVACAHAGMGETHRLLGVYDKAELLLRQSVSLAEEHSRAFEAAVFSVRLGIIDYERGEYDRALSTLTTAAAQIQKMGDKDALARAYFHMAQTLFLSKHYVEAKARLLEASRLADQLGYDAFLAIEASNSVLLLQYAASEGIGDRRFVQLLDRVRSAKTRRLRASPDIRVDSPDRPSNIEVYAFAEGRVVINGRRVREEEWRSARAKEMFFYLLCSQMAKTREQIAVDLWPDLSPAKSTSNFHISLHRARHALFPGVISLEDGRYKISGDIGIWFDVIEFSRAVDDVTNAPIESAELAARLQEAVDLYTGQFLPTVYSEWAEEHRRALEAKYLKGLLKLARWYCENGDTEKALGLMGKLAVVDPYNDELLSDIPGWRVSKNTIQSLLAEFRQVEWVSGGVRDEPQLRTPDHPHTSQPKLQR